LQLNADNALDLSRTKVSVQCKAQLTGVDAISVGVSFPTPVDIRITTVQIVAGVWQLNDVDYQISVYQYPPAL
jgi:hypothetical protein